MKSYGRRGTFSSRETLETEDSPGSSYCSSGDENVVSEDDGNDDGMSYDTSDFSSSDYDSDMSYSTEGSDLDDDYDDLMATLPIVGRKKDGAATAVAAGPPAPPLLPPQPPQQEGLPVLTPPPYAPASPRKPRTGMLAPYASPRKPRTGMLAPFAAAVPTTLATADNGGGGAPPNPLEGLAMLQSIRSELEQVGRMIVAKKDGEKFLQRAHILASINWLATNIPACVLDHLGKEIRGTLNRSAIAPAAAALVEDAKMQPEFISSSEISVVMSDDDSDGSDLSEADLSDSEEDSDIDDEDFDSGMELVAALKASTMETRAPQRTSLEKNDRTGGGGVRSLFAAGRTREPPTRHEMEQGFRKTQRRKSIIHDGLSAEDALRKLSRVSVDYNEAEANGSNENAPGVLPSVSHFQCALLFIDISGFTSLATLLDPENLSKVRVMKDLFIWKAEILTWNLAPPRAIVTS